MLAHAFISKVHRLILVLNKLERAYEGVGTRQTDFEIVGADKRNPTTLSLKPVPRKVAYDPAPAMRWGIEQLDAVSRGEAPDERVGSDIAFDLVKLAHKENEHGYKAFWINGHAEAVRFDENFEQHAQRLASERVAVESPNRWHTGVAEGVFVGKLQKIDDLDADSEFVIVPPTGPDFVRCTFSEAMRDEIGHHVFQTVRVHGKLHYDERSPFPYKIEARKLEGLQPRRKALSQMRGVFADRAPRRMDWESLFNAG